MNHKKSAIWIVTLLIICITIFFLAQPIFVKAILAKYKSTDHFLSLPEDTRVRYEEQARGNALIVSELLTESKKAVEDVLNTSFKEPIIVYICATQDSFNEYIFLSKNVKGAVFWGKFFLSPHAFTTDQDALTHLVKHELTHYLFYTKLGERKHMNNVPMWFREGLAEFVANGGSEYTKEKNLSQLMSSKVKASFLSGDLDYWFYSKDGRHAVTEKGVVNWVLYRAGALFVHFIHDSNPDKFEELLQLLLSGAEFNEAIQQSFEADTKVLLDEFTLYLKSPEMEGS